MEIGTFEAKNRFSELLDRVEKGEEVTITRHGKPVAKLVAAKARDVAKARAAAEEILRMRESLPADTLKGLTIKQLIEEGRRW
ncbi:MAG: type II toxin-antitoxin system Phd/YefM family antitoxin [Phyllobacteriaceae bacterium]|nr:type II toxin-antitoxin system Phd/YefM family antitoxin [Phyllobacteriaceae bacterium]